MKTQSVVSFELANWYKINKRDMPWRSSKDPYKIWLSEIILQQTQVVQGTPYYLKFIECYPSLQLLAQANEDDVLRLWQGLGYYSRARNLLYTAKYIKHQLHGVFPNSYAGLLQLKGIGDYTASAIASIAYNEAVAVVDGNVNRVISRLFKVNVSGKEGAKTIKNLAFQLLNQENPSEHNQAMMELGSLICKPQSPKCNICPISNHCLAYKDKVVKNFPSVSIKKEQKLRFLNFIVKLTPQGKVLLTKRTGNDIWKNMYTFPFIESNKTIEFLALLKEFDPKLEPFELLNIMSLTHILSHQILKATFYLIQSQTNTKANLLEMPSDSIWTVNESSSNIVENSFKKNNIFEVEFEMLGKTFPLPRLISKYIETKEIKEIFNKTCP